MEILHRPVLLEETLELLKPECEGALFVDGTLGEGGHTEGFLTRYADSTAIGIDADAKIQAKARERLSRFAPRVQFYNGWSDDFFAEYPSEAQRPDAILCDLGISIFHYAESGRGFSFQKDEALDMRLNAKTQESAADIVNTRSEKELADLFFLYGEEKYSRRIARSIVEKRCETAFSTAKALADVVYHAVPQAYRHGKLHPATKTFQALRIAVNSELDRLPRLLESAFSCLRDGGKFGVITFHSLEDRIVKRYFRDLAKSCTCPDNSPICKCEGRAKARLLVKKSVTASESEVRENPPSRSARLRVVQKIPSKNSNGGRNK